MRETKNLNGLWVSEGRTFRVPGAFHPPVPWERYPGFEDGGGFLEAVPASRSVQTTITVPAHWKGRAVSIKLERQFPKARVLLDGVEAGRMDGLTAEVDLTGLVQAGANHRLELILENEYGLLGDAVLLSKPLGPRWGTLSIETSVTGRFFQVTASLERGEGPLRVGGTVRDSQGSVSLEFEAVVPAGHRSVTVWRPWFNPRLWEPDDPHLYALELELLVDRTPCDSVTLPFGFREFSVSGREFRLNDRPFRLRPVLCGDDGDIPTIAATLANFKAAGFNFAEIWPREYPYEQVALWLEEADRQGFLLSAPTGFSGSRSERYVAEARRDIEALGNHPSLVMWGTNANQFGSALNMDPRVLGRKRDRWFWWARGRKRRDAAGREMLGILKGLDPTRPVFVHHGGGLGDVHTLNMYLNLIPLQEREEWLTEWAAHGELPLLIVEFGTPLHVSFNRGRSDFGDGIVSEPWVTEFAAIYLGPEAYRLEESPYRRMIAAHHLEGQKYQHFHYAAAFDFTAPFQAVQELFILNTWRSWRLTGITGGMIPWHNAHGWRTLPYDPPAGWEEKEVPAAESADEPGRGFFYPSLPERQLLRFSPRLVAPAGKALVETNGPTLAWLAGAPELPLTKDHHFRSGDLVRKAVTLVNDLGKSAPYRVEVTVVNQAEVLKTFTLEGSVASAANLLLPLEFVAPVCEPGEKRDLCLLLEAQIGNRSHRDCFPLRVYGSAKTRPPLTLFDPVGKTEKALRSAGWAVSAVNGWASPTGVLWLGRGVLSHLERTGTWAAFEAFVTAGGRAVLLGTEPGELERFWGFRVGAYLGRRFYPVPGAGLDAVLDSEDLRDWNGESQIREPRPQLNPGEARLGKWWFPYHGNRWGGTGAVSSLPVEKPHRSAWRAVVEGEFDLAYSPWLELEVGTGRVVLTTFDWEDHLQTDPACARLLEVVQERADASVNENQTLARRVVLVTSRSEGTRLDELGMVHEKAPQADYQADLLVFDGTVHCEATRLRPYLEQGGKAYFLADPPVPGLSPPVVKREVCGGWVPLPSGPEFRGLGWSDLRPRVDLSMDAFEADSALLARTVVGRGVAVFSRLSDRVLDADKKTYLRFTRWRWMHAESTVLAALGASFRADQRVFHPREPERFSLAGPWKATLHRAEGVLSATLNLPVTWEELGGDWEASTADVVLERTLPLPSGWRGRELQLFLGKVDNVDETFANGVLVSEPHPVPYANHPRVYRIPASAVGEAGTLTLTVRLLQRARVSDYVGGGGVYGPREELRLEPLLPEEGVYHPDYRADYVLGDDPYRYFNW